MGNGYDILGRDQASWGVRTNTDEEGNKHHYDPITGKTWQEDAEGRWLNSQGPLGHEMRSHTDINERGDGWETAHESTRGEGGGYREWGESWSNERSFDDNRWQDVQGVLDNVQSEPIVEQGLWDGQVGDQVARGEVGNDQVGASGEFLSYNAESQGSMGIDATRGAYVDASAEAGLYVARGEAHWANDHGTSAQAEGYIGAQGEATAGAQIGPGGARVEAGLEAFAGGRIEGGVSQDLGPASVGASGSLSYGIGAHAEGSAEFSADRVGVSFDVGATLGVGASISLDLSVSPNEIIDGLSDVGESLAESPFNPGNWW